MKQFYLKKNQLLVLKLFAITILILCVQLSFAQCPMPCTDHQTTYLTSALPICGGATTIDASGDVDNGSDCDDGSQNCFEFIIINDMMSVTNILTRIGKGNGCNGEVDYFYTEIDGVCSQIPSTGSQNEIAIPFGMNNEISVFICDNSSGQVSMCGLCADQPCDFDATCIPVSTTFVEGCDASVVPPASTDFNVIYDNVTICGTTLFTFEDFIVQGIPCDPANPLGINRVYTLMDDIDGDGPSASDPFIECVHQFVIQDTSTPEIVCPVDMTVECPSLVMADVNGTTVTTTCPSTTTVTPGPITPGPSNSNCGFASGDIFTITYTVIDECDRQVSCTQTWTISNNGPSITCPADQLGIECLSDVVPGIPIVAGACGDTPTLEVSDLILTQGTAGCDGALYDRIFEITDECNRTASCTQQISIANQGPSITCPGDTTVACYGDIEPGIPTINVPCDINYDLQISDVQSTGTGGDPCFSSNFFITYTVTDDCGRTASCTQSFQVLDSGPTITCPPDATVECYSDIEPGTPTTNSNCGNTTFTASGIVADDIYSDSQCSGDIYYIRYTATDDCGRTATCNQRFTLQNNGPTITCPADMTVECIFFDNENILPTYETFCDYDATLTPGDVITTGELNCPGYSITYPYTVEDECGRTASCSFTCTIENDAPVITCPADLTVECADDVIPGTPTAVLACFENPIIVVDDNVTGIPGCDGTTYEYTFGVTDACQRSASCVQTITIQNDAPTITCPADQTISCPAEVVGITPTYAVSCDYDVILSVTTPVVDAAIFCTGGEINYTHSVEDECGRTASCVFTYIVVPVDEVIPTPPADLTLQCAADVPPPVDLTGTFNCIGDVTVSPNIEITPGDCPNSFVETRSWLFINDCVEEVLVQTITVNDDTTPVAPTPPADLNLQCEAELTLPMDLTAIDNCDGEITVSPTAEITDGDCPNSFIMVRTWTFTDDCGNSSSVSQTINVNDDTAPVAPSAPADVNLQCAADVIAPIDLTATDNCDDDITVSPTIDVTPGDCPNSFTEVRTWTFTDNCGNTSAISQTVNVNDNTPPVTPDAPEDVNVQCAADIPAPVALTASDNCDGDITVLPTAEISNETCTNRFTMIRTWTFTDDCGNASEVSQTIEVYDDTRPVVTVGAISITVECGPDNQAQFDQWLALNVANISGTDNCGTPELVYDASPNFSEVCGIAGYYIIQFELVDECGNSTPTVGSFTVEDTTSPYWSYVPDDTTIDCCDQPNFGTPVAEDICNGVVLTSSDETNMDGDCPNEYSITRTWVAYDDCGNPSIPVSQTVYVEDNTPPVIEANHPLLIGLDSGDTLVLDCSNTEVFSPQDFFIGDCCDPNASIMMMDDVLIDEGCTDEGVRMRMYCIWIGKDACGNTTEFELYLDYVDTTAPTFTSFPADATRACGSDTDTGTPTGEDDCDEYVLITYSDQVVSTDCMANGGILTTRTWTIEDECGNAYAQDQSILITDHEGPIIADLPNNITTECVTAPNFTQATATDECSEVVSLTFNDTTNDNGCAGSAVRTWTATDACGNASTASQTITFTDNTAPTFSTISSDIEIQCGEGTVFDMPTASDNCDDAVTVTSADETLFEGCATGFAIQRTWTATDACGNSATTSQTAHFVDNQDPYFTYIPEDINAGCENVDFGVAIATDDCDADLTLTQEDTETTSGCSTTRTRTWTVTDDCGNSATASQTITSNNDGAMPIISNVGGNMDLDCGETAQFSNPTVTDDCAETVLTFEDATSTSSCSTTTTRTWTATDNCGNVATASQSITTTNDNQAPTFGELASDFVGECNQEPAWDTPETFDDCGFVSLTFSDSNNGGNCESGYDITRTWTATDECGNSATITQTVWIYPTGSNNTMAFSYIPPDQTISCNEEMNFGTPIGTSSCEDFDLSFVDVTTEGDCGNYSITRKWTAINDCEGEATCEQTINVVDNVPPYFTYVPDDMEINCNQEVTFGTPTCEDECSHISNVTWEDEIVQTCGSSYSITRTWTISDACGNINSTSQRLDVNDTDAPVFANTLQDKTVGCEDTFEFDTPTATESCGGNFELTFEDEVSNNDCAVNYSVTRTWTAIDECGNISNTSQTITRPADLEAPIFNNLPDNMEVACSANASFNMVNASDNCSNAAVTYEDTTIPGNCEGTYTLERTWTATDNCGNTTSATRSIQFSDNTAPTFVSTPAGTVIDCNTTPTFGTPIVEDNCGQVELTYNDETSLGDCASGYTITRTWTARDACGNEVTTSQMITVSQETTVAFNNIPANQTISCNDELTFGTPEVTSNCNESVELDFVEEFVDGTCATSYSVVRTWTAIACGVEVTAASTITVVDDQIPTFDAIPNNKTIACGDALLFDAPTFSDNCSEVEMSFTDATATQNCEVNTTRTWMIADACGNVASTSQTITSIDSEAPVFVSTPANFTIDCNTTPTFGTPVIEDNCGSVELTFTDDTSVGDCTTGYTVTRTWTAIDACGNEVNTTQIITISAETTTITAAFNNIPSDQTISCNEELNFGTPEITSNCSETIELAFVDEMIEGTCATAYTMIRTWTANACGVEITASSTITVEDDQIPTFDVIPENKTITCGDALQFDTPTFSDNCSDVELSHTDATANTNCEVNTTRTWTIADACGNVATTSQTITTMDDVAPIITPFTTTASFNCDAEITIDTPTALDNCSNVSMNFSDEITDEVCAGSYKIFRTWTATDGCGNMSSTIQEIEVSDNEAPVLLSTPEDYTITCYENPNFGTPTFDDNCGELSLTFDDQNSIGDCTTGYEITRTWLIADGCGNTVTTSQTITIVADEEAILSFVSVPMDQTIQCGVDLEFDTPSATSTCGELAITFEDAMLAGSCGSNYSMTRTWTIEDGCENELTTSQTIFVVDEEAPTLAPFTATTSITCDAEIPLETPAAFDNCGNVTVEHTDQITNGLCAENYNITRTWTATDECGNTTSTVQQIEVSDNSAPTLLDTPADYSIACNEEPVFGTPTYEDNCGTVEMTFDDNYSVGDCTVGYDITRTWTIVDACGNEITTQQRITVMANSATSLVFDNNPSDLTVTCGSELNFETPLAVTDPTCGEATITFEDNMVEGTCASSYAVTRTWTASDDCENVAIVSQTIFVEDETAPVFTSTPENKVLNCLDQLAFDELEAFDDCGNIGVEFTDEIIADPNCANAFVQIRTWTATDACGNATSASQTITVEDNTIPYFTTTPQNKVISCNENVIFDEIEAIDDCGDITITYVDFNESSDLCSGLNKITRTWTVSDGCGNVNAVLQSITIEDDKAPEFISTLDDKYLSCSETADLQIPQVLDDCSDVVIQYLDETIEEDDNCTSGLSFKRTWMATDECGNQSTKEQFIYVEDTEAPVFENVSEIFLTEQEFSNWRLPEVTVIDNCSAVTISGPAEEIETGCREIKYTYTWFASDHCGNRSEMSTEVHVEQNANDDCLLISPNPITDGDLKVIFEAAIDGNSKVKVYDLLGREVYNIIHEVTEGQNRIFLNLNHLSASTYVITVEADKRLYSRKFVKILN